MDLEKREKLTAFWKGLRHQTRRTAAGVTEAARTGAAAVGQKTEETLAYARLRASVRDVKEEIALQMGEIGRLVYDTHREEEDHTEEIEEILTYVDSLYEQLQGHERELKTMKGVRFCGVCAAENKATNVYCHSCGQPLVQTRG